MDKLRSMYVVAAELHTNATNKTHYNYLSIAFVAAAGAKRDESLDRAVNTLNVGSNGTSDYGKYIVLLMGQVATKHAFNTAEEIEGSATKHADKLNHANQIKQDLC